MSRARQAAPRTPAPRYTPSPDSLRGCAAPPRATLSVPELGHEAERSRFKPTKPLPGFPKTETLHPLIPRPKSSFRHVCRAVSALPVWGSRGRRRGVPSCWHSLTRARGEAKLRAPVRGALEAVPCLCSAVHVALPFLTGGRAGISPTP